VTDTANTFPSFTKESFPTFSRKGPRAPTKRVSSAPGVTNNAKRSSAHPSSTPKGVTAKLAAFWKAVHGRPAPPYNFLGQTHNPPPSPVVPIKGHKVRPTAHAGFESVRSVIPTSTWADFCCNSLAPCSFVARKAYTARRSSAVQGSPLREPQPLP